MRLENYLQDVPPDIQQSIIRASKLSGIPVDTLSRIANIESSGDPSAINRNARGLFQIMPETWESGRQKYKGQVPFEFTNRYDPEQNAALASLVLKENAEAFRSKFGRPPTGPELYTTHFLGTGDASRILANPSKYAADLVPTRVSRGNPSYFYEGDRPLTGAQLQSKIASKFKSASPTILGSYNTPRPVNIPITFRTDNKPSSWDSGFDTASYGRFSGSKPFSSVAKLSMPKVREEPYYSEPSYESPAPSRTPAATSTYTPSSSYRPSGQDVVKKYWKGGTTFSDRDY